MEYVAYELRRINMSNPAPEKAVGTIGFLSLSEVRVALRKMLYFRPVLFMWTSTKIK
jgi:hypothetical protein